MQKTCKYECKLDSWSLRAVRVVSVSLMAFYQSVCQELPYQVERVPLHSCLLFPGKLLTSAPTAGYFSARLFRVKTRGQRALVQVPFASWNMTPP